MTLYVGDGQRLLSAKIRADASSVDGALTDCTVKVTRTVTPKVTRAYQSVTCWDGSQESRLGLCGNPTGQRGLAWVFPSMEQQDCGDKPGPGQSRMGRLTLIECFDTLSDGSRVRINYSHWSSVGVGRGHYDRDGMDRTDLTDRSGNRLYRWLGVDEGEYKAAQLYALEPYSVALYVSRPDQRLNALNSLVVMRPVNELRGIQAAQ